MGFPLSTKAILETFEKQSKKTRLLSQIHILLQQSVLTVCNAEKSMNSKEIRRVKILVAFPLLIECAKTLTATSRFQF